MTPKQKSKMCQLTNQYNQSQKVCLEDNQLMVAIQMEKKTQGP
jgi:hypothetical protein